MPVSDSTSGVCSASRCEGVGCQPRFETGHLGLRAIQRTLSNYQPRRHTMPRNTPKKIRAKAKAPKMTKAKKVTVKTR